MKLVNNPDLNANIVKFNNLIERYEDTYLNLYNELNKSSFFWQDNKSRPFYDNTNVEKLKIITFHNELNRYSDIYSYIYERYSEFGKIIEFELKEKDRILVAFSRCNERIKQAIASNNNVNIGFASEISGQINSNLRTLTKMQTDLQELKFATKEAIQKIEDIEREVANKISSLKLQYIKESDITPYI